MNLRRSSQNRTANTGATNSSTRLRCWGKPKTDTAAATIATAGSDGSRIVCDR